MWEWQICEVCYLLDGDNSTKPCYYCSDCQAWICQSDLSNWTRRARAMFERMRR